ncbi:hypothetical protein DERP_009671 [Dermatophagoides pteronyssinus]|uniref:Uncharacterized protein n=1 Tax=Dermatophagoides pteronyssinus TaxID=6956 RepID=A0ABQ8JB45_DERPT|nr:hypothetical protein DERP_009671 [Dermatophagoides pteronyssinus]
MIIEVITYSESGLNECKIPTCLQTLNTETSKQKKNYIRNLDCKLYIHSEKRTRGKNSTRNKSAVIFIYCSDIFHLINYYCVKTASTKFSPLNQRMETKKGQIGSYESDKQRIDTIRIRKGKN